MCRWSRIQYVHDDDRQSRRLRHRYGRSPVFPQTAFRDIGRCVSTEIINGGRSQMIHARGRFKDCDF